MSSILSHLTSQSTQSNALPKIFVAVVVVTVVGRLWTFLRGLRNANYLPGLRPLFNPFEIPGLLFPTSWWNASARDLNWTLRSSLYTEDETIAIAPLLTGKPMIWTSNLDVARQIAPGENRTDFYKPSWSARTLLLWGMNLVAADGDVWRRHRRILGAAFNNELLVWDETLKTYREMIASEKWDEKGTGSVPAVQALTFKLALIILGKCAFGFSLSWDEPPRASDGGMSIQEIIRIVIDTSLLQVFAPKWMLQLPFKKFRESNIAFKSLALFMKEQVASRKTGIENETRKDSFSLLVKANEQEESKYKLSQEELIGNIFIMLFAGHETTANSLAATLAMLAVHQNVQDEVFEEIKNVVGFDRDPEFEDYHRLNKVIAPFFEALRMFPSGHIMIREAINDTVIRIPKPRGQEGTISMAIAKGQVVIVDMVGLHYNPRYYDDPTSFKPSRWYGVGNDSEDFTAFSTGPRACVGRKFATTEVVCFLTMLLRDWKVMPKLNEGESEQEWKARVLNAKIILTLGIKDAPLTFVRRK